MGFWMMLLLDYWPNVYDTFTPGSIDKEGKLYWMESHLNVTSLMIWPEDFAEWIINFDKGEVSEFA